VIGGASIYPFVHNILLAARAEGLGGVPITFVVPQEPAVAALLGIPPDHGIAVVIALGRPAHEVTRLRRREVDEFTHVDTWTGPSLRS
jgi:nitroreductase